MYILYIIWVNLSNVNHPYKTLKMSAIFFSDFIGISYRDFRELLFKKKNSSLSKLFVDKSRFEIYH